MPLTLGPFKINLNDKLRSGFRVKYNLLVDKVIKDGEGYKDGIKLITHDGTELLIDITDFFYSKEVLDETFFIEYATEEEAGKIRIATMEEVMEGNDDLTVVTPYKLWQLLLSINGRGVIAGEDLMPGDMVYLELIDPEDLPEEPEEPEEPEGTWPPFPFDPEYPNNEEDPEEPVDPEDPEAPEFFPVLKAFKAIATNKLTCAMGFVEYEALAGEETFIRFSGNISTYHEKLVPGAYYYLNHEIAGAITMFPTNEPGAFLQIIGYAISDLELMLEIHRPDLNWGPVFTEKFPPLYYTVGLQSTASILLTDYLQDWNVVIPEPEEENPDEILEVSSDSLSYRFLLLPDWVNLHTVVFDNMNIGGMPTRLGVWKSFLEVIDYSGRRYLQEIELHVLPAPKLKATLMDIQLGEDIGPVPGIYPLPEGKWDLGISLRGFFSSYIFELTGGGPTGNQVNVSVEQEVLPDGGEVLYRFFLESDGIITEAGQFDLAIKSFRGEQVAGDELLQFIFYDEEFLAKLKFFFTKAAADIGEISPDSTSVFEYPAGANNKVVVTDVEHDLVKIDVSFGGTVIRTVTYGPFEESVTEGEYYAWEDDEDLLEGDYEIAVVLQLVDENDEDVRNDVLKRSTRYSISEEPIEAVGGMVELITMQPGTRNFEVLAVLETEGNLIDPLPSNWNLLSRQPKPLHDFVEFQLFQKKGDGLTEVNVSLYTGQPQFISLLDATTDSELYAFGFKNSTMIGQIHKPETSFRYIERSRLGGASGPVVSLISADFSFDELEDITDEEPTEEPSVEARAALEDEIIDGVKYFDVRVDNLTIEIHEPENELLNYLRVKQNGILFNHFQKIPGKRLLGNMTGALGNIYDVPVKSLMSEIVPGDILDGEGIKDYIDDKFDEVIDGTPNKLPLFGLSGKELIDSNVWQYQGNIGVGVQLANEAIHAFGNIKATNSLISEVPNGARPVIVTSRTLNTNLNADLLDNEEGTYYLDWNNFINKPVEADQYYYRGTSQGMDANDLILAGWYDNGATTPTTTNVPVAKPGFIQVTPYRFGAFNAVSQDYITTGAVDANYGRRFTRVSWAGVYSAWKEYAFRDWVVANYVPLTRTISTTAGILGGGALSSNLTLSFDTVFGDARYALVGHTHANYMPNATSALDWDLVASDGLAKFNLSSVNGPGLLVHGLYIPHGGNPSFGSSIAFRNGSGYYRSRESGSWGSWLQIADRAWVLAQNYSTTVGTVTSVGMSVPTGLTVSPATITTAGIFAVSYAAGYSIPLTSKQNQWDIAYNRWIRPVVENGSIDNFTFGGVGTWGSSAANRPSPFGSSLTFVGGTSTTGDNMSGAFVNTILAATTGDWYVRYNFGSVYQLWTSKQFSDTDVANGVTAFGWGNHALAGYALAARALTVNGTSGRVNVTGGTQNLTADRTWTVDLAPTGIPAGTFRSVTYDIYGRVVGGSNPTTLAGYGLDTTVYTKTQVDALISGAAGVSGSGTTGYFPKFTGATSIGNSVMMDTGSEINVGSGRSFGVEGAAAMRSYLHVHDYLAIGKAGNHGSIVVHSVNSATAHASAAIDIQSTTKGFGVPFMTAAQRLAIPSPKTGLNVYQTDAGAGGSGPYWYVGAGLWFKPEVGYLGAG